MDVLKHGAVRKVEVCDWVSHSATPCARAAAAARTNARMTARMNGRGAVATITPPRRDRRVPLREQVQRAEVSQKGAQRVPVAGGAHERARVRQKPQEHLWPRCACMHYYVIT